MSHTTWTHSVRVNCQKKHDGVSKIGVPQNGWFIMANLYNANLGYPYLQVSSLSDNKTIPRKCPWWFRPHTLLLGLSKSPFAGEKTHPLRWWKKSSDHHLKWRIYPSIYKVLRMSSGVRCFVSINPIVGFANVNIGKSRTLKLVGLKWKQVLLHYDCWWNIWDV